MLDVLQFLFVHIGECPMKQSCSSLVFCKCRHVTASCLKFHEQIKMIYWNDLLLSTLVIILQLVYTSLCAQSHLWHQHNSSTMHTGEKEKILDSNRKPLWKLCIWSNLKWFSIWKFKPKFKPQSQLLLVKREDTITWNKTRERVSIGNLWKQSTLGAQIRLTVISKYVVCLITAW